MSCQRFERLIALHVEGDLPTRQAQRLERHFISCAACREFVEGLRESQIALKGLGLEFVSETIFQELRQRVLDEIAVSQAQPKTTAWMSVFQRWQWQVGLAGAMIMLLVGFVLYLFLPETPKPPVAKRPAQSPKVVAPAPAPASPVPVKSAPNRIAAQGSRRTAATANRRPLGEPRIEAVNQDFSFMRIEPLTIEPLKIEPPAASDELVVKLVTDDPEVVIYWLVDRKGE
ncbi:MAG: zf-HC2 domain-containing protein [Acidobacteria bacterium]|nr:zf-HC2 domain-containing protein [Acidobacteriota bacterium]